MGGGRDTGHFGTGTYAVSKEKNLPPFYTESRPVSALITRPDDNLYLGRSEELDKAHRALRKVNRLADSDKLLPKDKILRAIDDFDYRFSLRESDPELSEMVELVHNARFDLPGVFSKAPEKMIDAANEHIKARLGAGGSFWKERVQRDSASTRYMKSQGFDGVNTGLAPELDNTTYGSVVYRKKKFAHGGEVSKFIKSKEPKKFNKGGEAVADLPEMLMEGAYNVYKESIPSSVRIAAQTLLGDRTKPFTNKDFTEKELAGYAGIIKETEERLGTAPQVLSENANMLKNIEKEIARNKDTDDSSYVAELIRQKDKIEKNTAKVQKKLSKYKQGKGSVQYDDYYDSKNPDFKNLANTIGRFTYEKQPSGEIAIKDRWDFDNEMDKSYASKFEKLSPVQRIKELAKDLMTPNLDTHTALTLGAMATLGTSKGRDINLRLPAGNTEVSKFIKSKK
jgi:hypothetical protein